MGVDILDNRVYVEMKMFQGILERNLKEFQIGFYYYWKIFDWS
jgi:hypothetical protein